MDPGEHKAKRLARQFYAVGPSLVVRCLVTANMRPNWHHLDEAKPRLWDYRNIVPITGDLNDAIDKRQHRYLPTELWPGTLEDKGREHFRYWRFAHGYACARLGSFLMMPTRPDAAVGFGRDPDSALSFCASALVNLRPISALRLAVDTLERSVLRIVEDTQWRSKISPRSKARLAIELGSYFCDYGCFQEAIEWYQLADAHLAQVQSVIDDGLRARAVQHRGIAIAGLGNLPEAESVLERASDMLEATALYPEGLANDALWKARMKLHQRAPDLDECAELLRAVYRWNKQGLVSAWTYAEALWTDAEHRLLRGRKTDSLDLAREGTRQFQEAGIVPTAVLPCRSASMFTERYPQEVYVLPRNPTWLRDFRKQTGKVHKSLHLGCSSTRRLT